MRSKVRVLLLALDGFPTFRPDVTSLWGYLNREAIECDLLTVQSANFEPGVQHWAGGDLYLSRRAANKILEQVRWFFFALKILWSVPRGRYDAIIVRDQTFIAIPARLFARKLGIPFFYWMSFPIAESLARLAGQISVKAQPVRWLYLRLRGNLGAVVLYRLVLPFADHIFAQSDKMVEDLTHRKLRAENISSVPMCVDPIRFPPMPPRSRSRHEKPVVAYLGECSRIRRIDFILEALAHVKAVLPTIKLLIVGDALEKEDQLWLRGEVARLGLDDNTEITGWVPAASVRPLLAQVDVALALMAPDPILDSTSPTKLVEYLAMGLPVVANDHPDQRHVITTSQAGIVTLFKPQAYADAIIALLRDNVDREALGNRGREWVMTNRNYSVMAVGLAAILRTQIHARKKHYG
ncbi:glycosyltransferase family 4 protein [Rhizobium sp. BE258]|uniref:glycosyltransferase family 4 protein n=1 Tax=Rhizobium sp. BE258 TaxID=2817722 RepID=UPI0028569155|nr:glycosyltransferase family 4 protein [Rhizobium sp. BE258]MDR7145206.1 glycosyltransferase involved in cell wall biosynthesis [Rhizobium sp. BE258]